MASPVNSTENVSVPSWFSPASWVPSRPGSSMWFTCSVYVAERKSTAAPLASATAPRSAGTPNATASISTVAV